MLYIVRHGQTAKNKKMLLQGRSDQTLNEEGWNQARQIADKLREKGIEFDRIYSSPLIRAVQTAQIIADEIILRRDEAGDAAGHPASVQTSSVITDERLIEMDYGPYEGMDLTDPAPEVMAFFRDFAGTPAPEGMEQLSDVVARTGGFADEVLAEAAEGNVLISTHAIAMKGILEHLTPDSAGAYWSRYIGNCEVYAVEADSEGYGIPYGFISLE